MDYYRFVSQPSFFLFLVEIDRSIADEALSRACAHCGAKLNRANYWRSGHGFPADADEACKLRFSLCCKADGCRKRCMPDSLRFLHGKSYTALVVVILATINHGTSKNRAETLMAQLKVSRQTVNTWIKWWQEKFAASDFWKTKRARFMPVPETTELPFSLVQSFGTQIRDPAPQTEQEKLINVLRFLSKFRRR